MDYYFNGVLYPTYTKAYNAAISYSRKTLDAYISSQLGDTTKLFGKEYLTVEVMKKLDPNGYKTYQKAYKNHCINSIEPF